MTRTGNSGHTRHERIRNGLVIVVALAWLPGCAGWSGPTASSSSLQSVGTTDQIAGTESGALQRLVPSAQLDSPATLVAETPASTTPALSETSPDEPVDPFAKSGEDALEEYDPWEGFNTKIFEFNRQVDRWVLKPVAQGYNAVVPNAVQVGVSNFISNLRFPPRFFNNIFQGKVKGAGLEVGRFLVNSTLGFAGFLDVAKDMDLNTPEEDTGQTLGFYGVKPGPYLVLPFLPPFTVRDFTGFLGDIALNPINWLVAPLIEVNNVPSLIAHKNRTTTSLVQIGARVGEIVNERSLNLEKFQGVEEATLDLYAAVRNAYLQKRARAIRE